MTLGFLNVQSRTGSLFSFLVLLCDTFNCLCKYLWVFESRTLLRSNIFPAVCRCDFCVNHYILLFIFLVGFRRYEVHAGTGSIFLFRIFYGVADHLCAPGLALRCLVRLIFDCGTSRCGHLKWFRGFLGPMLYEIPDWIIAGLVHWSFGLASRRGLYLVRLFFLPCLQVVLMQFFLLRKNIGLPESAIANMFFVFVFSFTMWPFQLSL